MTKGPWGVPNRSSGEPPSLGAFVKAFLFFAVLVVLFLIWVNVSG